MLDAANVWLKEARSESFMDIADIATIASIGRGTMKQLSKGDRLERKVVYTALVEIIGSKGMINGCCRWRVHYVLTIIIEFAASQALKLGDEDVEDYGKWYSLFLGARTKVNNGMAVFLAGQKSDSDDFTDIEDDGSGGNVDADDEVQDFSTVLDDQRC
jgi:hypothetical protein